VIIHSAAVLEAVKSRPPCLGNFAKLLLAAIGALQCRESLGRKNCARLFAFEDAKHALVPLRNAPGNGRGNGMNIASDRPWGTLTGMAHLWYF
jgi:hypothetical protein